MDVTPKQSRIKVAVRVRPMLTQDIGKENIIAVEEENK